MGIKKCVLVGTGGRGISAYVAPLTSGKYADSLKLCGIYDKVKERAELCSKDYGNIPVYDSFDAMVDDVKPDYIIVTTKDCNHHEYIIRSLDMGYDVITEKPITNTRKKALEIMEAEKRSGHTVRVIFNMRYMKPISDLKEVLSSGVIGKINHVDFTWLLNRKHGADYFRRWHRNMENTTSLLVHKSTHHFDVVNWVADKTPKSVFARGTLEFYGKNGEYRGECCHKCEHAEKCPLYFDITTPETGFNKKYYYDLEEASGYYRDGCVFAEDIDIFDRMALNVLFEDGATMNYSLSCYNFDEGMKMIFIGTKGRVEFGYYTAGPKKADPIIIRIITDDDKIEEIETSFGTGTHGGADALMFEMLFGLSDEPDPLGKLADSKAGYYSLAIGDMAVQSIRTGKDVDINDLG